MDVAPTAPRSNTKTARHRRRGAELLSSKTLRPPVNGHDTRHQAVTCSPRPRQVAMHRLGETEEELLKHEHASEVTADSSPRLHQRHGTAPPPPTWVPVTLNARTTPRALLTPTRAPPGEDSHGAVVVPVWQALLVQPRGLPQLASTTPRTQFRPSGVISHPVAQLVHPRPGDGSRAGPSNPRSARSRTTGAVLRVPGRSSARPGSQAWRQRAMPSRCPPSVGGAAPHLCPWPGQQPHDLQNLVDGLRAITFEAVRAPRRARGSGGR